MKEYVSSVKVGETIPDYEFEIYQNDDTKTVKFSDYRGKWLIVMFYPADFTFVCPTELEDMAKLYPKIKDNETKEQLKGILEKLDMKMRRPT